MEIPKREREALATVWHEAATQLAFNRGVHHDSLRLPPGSPKGLLRFSEAPGMMSLDPTMASSDLINASRWET